MARRGSVVSALPLAGLLACPGAGARDARPSAQGETRIRPRVTRGRRLLGSVTLLWLAIDAAGCDGLMDGGYTPEPLAVVHGTIRVPVPPDPPLEGRSLKLAVAWLPARYTEIWTGAEPLSALHTDLACVATPHEPESCDGTPARGSERCRWTDESYVQLVRAFPFRPGVLSFELPIMEAPPPVARVDLSRQGGRGTLALGYVVAFEDEDGDGVFRHGTPENPPEPVRAMTIVNRHVFPSASTGPYTSYFITYLEGVPETDDSGLPPGFQVFRWEVWTDRYLRTLGGRQRGLPMNTPVELTVLPRPNRTLGCSEGITEHRYLDGIPEGYAPVDCGDVTLWWRMAAGFLSQAMEVRACEEVVEEYAGDFSCAQVPPPAWDCRVSGWLRIRVATQGSPPPGAGAYRVKVSRPSGEPVIQGTLEPNDHLTLAEFTTGDYVVELQSVAPGCTSDSRARVVTVTEGGTEDAAFAVQCGSTSSTAPPDTAEGPTAGAAYP